MNVGDSEDEARGAFDDYICKYYPELSQAMDLGNWGPVGHARPDRASGSAPSPRPASTTSSAASARSTSSARSSASPERSCPVHRRESEVATWRVALTCSMRRHAGGRRLHVGRGRRRRDDHLRRRAPRAGRGRGRGRASTRGGWPVVMNNEHQVRRGRADVRFPMAPPRNLHQAMVASDEVIIITNLEWANRFAHVSAVKETCAANGKIASVEPGMGAVGPDRRATSTTPSPAPSDAMAVLEGKKHMHVTTPRRHRLPRLHRGPPRARGHADQAPRPDDGPGPAVGRGRLRRRRGPTPTAPPSSTG